MNDHFDVLQRGIGEPELGGFLFVCLFSGAGAWVRWTGFTVAC